MKRVRPIRQKGVPLPFDFLLAEFRKGGLLFRVRYRVVQFPSLYHSIQIRERGSKWSEASKVRENRAVVGSLVSEKRLFKAMAKHVSEHYKISTDSIVFRWEDGSLRLPKK
jgi:hypothetical protein